MEVEVLGITRTPLKNVQGGRTWRSNNLSAPPCPQLRRMQEMIARMQAQMQLQLQGGDGDGGAHGHHV